MIQYIVVTGEYYEQLFAETKVETLEYKYKNNYKDEVVSGVTRVGENYKDER